MLRPDLYESFTFFNYNFSHLLIKCTSFRDYFVFKIEELETADLMTVPNLNLANFTIDWVYFYPIWVNIFIGAITSLTIFCLKSVAAFLSTGQCIIKNGSNRIIEISLERKTVVTRTFTGPFCFYLY